MIREYCEELHLTLQEDRCRTQVAGQGECGHCKPTINERLTHAKPTMKIRTRNSLAHIYLISVNTVLKVSKATAIESRDLFLATMRSVTNITTLNVSMGMAVTN